MAEETAGPTQSERELALVNKLVEDAVIPMAWRGCPCRKPEEIEEEAGRHVVRCVICFTVVHRYRAVVSGIVFGAPEGTL